MSDHDNVTSDNPLLNWVEAPEEDIEIGDAEIDALIKDVQKQMMDRVINPSDNPLENNETHQLVATFLSAIPRGVRWLAAETQLDRKRLSHWLETGEGFEPDVVRRITDTILKKDAFDKKRMVEKYNRLHTEEKDTTDHIPDLDAAQKKLYKPVNKYNGLNRQQRRMAMRQDRLDARKKPTPPESEPLL